MNIPLNANVHCSDGAAGRSTVIVVDPRTETVTHVVVDSQGTEYLVPIDVISESGTDHIQLRWSLAELAKAERYDKVVYVGCLLYTSPSPRDRTRSRMPSSA